MKVNQLNEIVLSVYKQITGNQELTEINTSNVVDTGKQIFDNTDIDNYVKALTDRIGRSIFVNRKYQGNGLNVLMDKWEFGSVLQKIDCSLTDDMITTNESWNLKHKQSYSQDTFYQPTVSMKLFNKKTTFEIDVSFTEMQVKSSFNSMEELNAFVSMIFNAVENSLTVKIDGLIMSTINHMTATTLQTLGAKENTSIKCVNLLHLYNTKFADKKVTLDTALTNADFLKFASMIINTYTDRISKISTLFNIGAKERFTPKEDLNVIMLSDFKSACTSYLEADTYHKELVSLPNSDTVPYWQGTGTNYDFNSVSTINVKTEKASLNKSGILAVMFDKNAVAVCNEDRRVTTHYNAKGEFFTNFYKFECSYINDTNENFVVFFLADDVAA